MGGFITAFQRYELTPVAIAAGRRLGDRLFGGEPNARIMYDEIATVVFSHPPIGTIGLTEPAAIEEYGAENVKVRQARFPSMLYAFNEPEGKVKTALKLVLTLPEERVVGKSIFLFFYQFIDPECARGHWSGAFGK